MTFEDDKPIQCDGCPCLIYPGQTAITWRGHHYCSEDCLKDAMLDAFSSEVDEEPILTAADKADIYSDMQKGETDGI